VHLSLFARQESEGIIIKLLWISCFPHFCFTSALPKKLINGKRRIKLNVSGNLIIGKVKINYLSYLYLIFTDDPLRMTKNIILKNTTDYYFFTHGQDYANYLHDKAVCLSRMDNIFLAGKFHKIKGCPAGTTCHAQSSIILQWYFYEKLGIFV
jgi:hypothetical protein